MIRDCKRNVDVNFSTEKFGVADFEAHLKEKPRK